MNEKQWIITIAGINMIAGQMVGAIAHYVVWVTILVALAVYGFAIYRADDDEF